MKKAILLSGGIDSASLAYWKRPGLAININYGQKAAIAERNASKSIARFLKIELKCIDIDCSSLGSGNLVNRQPLSLAPVKEWWPYRNQLLITLGSMIAITQNATELMIGAVSTDKRHTDGRKKFFELANQLVSYQEGKLRITVPIIKYRSEELIKIAKVPSSILGWTHSCHVSNFPCGNCNGCKKHIHIKTLLKLI
jgi:7-cyano-7-deazaguanine synthase